MIKDYYYYYYCYCYFNLFYYVIFLNLLAPPDPPNNIVIKSVTAYSIFIQWSKGAFDGNSPITNYSVEYHKGLNWSSPIFTGKLLKANITKLSPFTNYSFRVCSRNNIGIACTKAHGTTNESGKYTVFFCSTC